MRWIIVADESTAEFYEQDKKYSAVRKSFEMHNEPQEKRSMTSSPTTVVAVMTASAWAVIRWRKRSRTPKSRVPWCLPSQSQAKMTAALNNGDITEFGLIAAPKFLGILRKSLGGAHGSEPCLTISKEVVGQGTAVVDRLLGEL